MFGTRALLDAHIENCMEERRRGQAALSEVKDDFSRKHEENKAEFKALRDANDQFKTLLLKGVLTLIGGLLIDILKEPLIHAIGQLAK